MPLSNIAAPTATESQQLQLPTWNEVLAAPVAQVEATIASGGLAPTKARLIQELLGRLRRDWGGFELGFMRAWAVADLRRYLSTLPGIGYKAATCVIAYSFGRDVCPVDTHTYRVAVRLGLVPPETPELGRQRCTIERPTCEGCPVAVSEADAQRLHCVAPEKGRYSRRGQGGEG